MAGPIFFDDFSQESPGINNYSSFAYWDVSNGTVDTVGYDLSWSTIYSNYVDLDGSTGDAGRLTTKSTFVLNPGTYVLSYVLAGNQRFGSDTVIVQAGSFSKTYDLIYTEPFALYEESFSLASTEGIKISFECLGGDNCGVLLDNVMLTGTTVPAPGALLLGVMGMGLVGWIRRRQTL